MRGMGCAAYVEEKRHAYTILVRKSQGYNKTKENYRLLHGFNIC